MECIGLLGNKGSGKDTLADYLVKEKNFVKYSFAKPIKDIAKIMFYLDDEQLYDDKKELIDKRWNLSPREIIQKIGTEIGQFMIFDIFPKLKDKISYRCFWLKHFEIFLENNKDKNIVISDVRFIHEVKYLKKLNFNIIKINRDNLKIDNHISENEINNIKDIDYVINNNYTKDVLYKQYEHFIYIPF